MKTDFSAKNINNATQTDLPDERFPRSGLMLLISAVLVSVVAISFPGCADGGSYVAGYSASYYAPDYSPYYGDYLYGGEPYWGFGPYYNTDIIIHGGHHRLYYGGHHFAHDWGGGFSRVGGGAFHSGGGRGR